MRDIARWSRSYSECRNCGTRRRRHHRRGCCRLCFDMMEHVWQAEAWDRTKPETIASMPEIPWWTREATIVGLDRRDWTDDEFERYRREYIRQRRVPLARLRLDEERRQNGATGWD